MTTTTTCTTKGCNKPVRAKGLCEACYAKQRRNQPGHCPCCGVASNKFPATNGRTHDRCLKSRRDLWHKYMHQIITAYGDRCECCGETTYEFLTIDHVNGDGNHHRKTLGKGNRRILLEIIHANFPSDYRVLCYNCNCGRERNHGKCPHKERDD